MATPSRLNSKGEEELKCGGCGDWFVPRDGAVDVVRIGKDANDPGTVICLECKNALGSRNLLHRDRDEVKCYCNSLDPEHKVCPVHFTLNV